LEDQSNTISSRITSKNVRHLQKETESEDKFELLIYGLD